MLAPYLPFSRILSFFFLSKISCLSFQRKLWERGGKHVFGLCLNWLIIMFFEIKLGFFIWQEPKSSSYPLPSDSLSGNKFWGISADMQKQICIYIKLKEYHIRFKKSSIRAWFIHPKAYHSIIKIDVSEVCSSYMEYL